MLTKQTQNSDLLAMLSRGGKSQAKGGQQAVAEGEGFDILSLLSEGKGANAELSELVGKKSEFAKILTEKGMLEDISADDLLNFFTESQGGQEGASLTDLVGQMDGELSSSDLPKKLKSQLDNVIFDGKGFLNRSTGEAIPKKNIVQLLTKVSEAGPQKEMSAEDIFSVQGKMEQPLARKEATPLKDMSSQKQLRSSEDFLNHRKMMTPNKQVDVAPQKMPQGFKQYRSEQALNNKSMIKPQVQTVNSLSQKTKIEELGKAKETAKPSQKNTIQDILQGLNSDTENIAQLQNNEQNSGMDFGHEFSGKQPGEVKTLDLSNIKAENRSELLQKVSNYIEQSYVSGQDSVDMVVKHDELGQFRVQVQKSGTQGQVNLEINAMTEQGHHFFAENEVELLRNLQQSGVKLNNFKISGQTELFAMGENSQSSFNSNSDSQSSFSGQQNRGEGSPFTGGGSQGDNRGQQRRRELWQEARSFSEQLYA